MPTVRELRQNRAKLVADAGAILTEASKANRSLTPEEDKRFSDLHAEADKIKVDIDRQERQQDAEAAIAQRSVERAEREGKSADEVRESDETYRAAFNAYLRGGMVNLSDEHRQLIIAHRDTNNQVRALGTGGSAGGYTIPQGFYDRLIENQKAYGGMRSAPVTVLTTGDGSSIPMALDDDTANAAAIVSENSAVTEQDVVFTQKTLSAYMYSSKIVRVSFQLLQDSAFDVEAYLARKFARRMAVGTNAHFTTGTGTGQPQGVVTGATLGKTGLTGQTTSVIYADLVDLEHAVDPAYRNANTRWMFHDSTLKALKKLVDSQQRPLWQPGIAVREPDTILSYQYVINQDMAVMAANAKSILFGDFSSYIIRDVSGGTTLRLEERYAEFLQVAFLNFERHDGLLADAGSHPIQYYANSAT